MDPFPSLFVSHGAPNLLIQELPVREFLSGFGAKLGRPKAIISISAHYETDKPTVGGGGYPPTLHDFGGFEPELYQFYYRAPGEPALASQIAYLLTDNGIETVIDRARGFDHGTWVPLMLLYPDAGIPVVSLSVCPDYGPDFHYRMGKALRLLRREGILVMGSGSATHNLQEFFNGRYRRDAPAPSWVRDFGEWLHDRVSAGAIDDLLNYRSQGPYAEENHPTEEHLLPFFVALGAADDEAAARVHSSYTYGVMAMDAYCFN